MLVVLTVTVLTVVPMLLWVLWFSLVRPSLRKEENLMGKVVLITGCDSGFGKELVNRLDRIGVQTAAACLTQSGCDELKSTCKLCTPVQCDITIDTDCQNLYQITQSILESNDTDHPKRTLFALVNNAGIARNGLLECLTDSTYQQSLSVNYLAARKMIHRMLPLMKNPDYIYTQNSSLYHWFINRGSVGRILNVCSIASHMPNPRGSPYCTSKAGLRGLSDCVRYELELWHGIWVSTIEPQFTSTPMVNEGFEMSNLSEFLRKETDAVSKHRKDMYGLSDLSLVYDIDGDLKVIEEEINDIKGLVEPSMDKVISSMMDGLCNPFPLKYYHPCRISQIFYFVFTCIPRWFAFNFMEKQSFKRMIQAVKKKKN